MHVAKGIYLIPSLSGINNILHRGILAIHSNISQCMFVYLAWPENQFCKQGYKFNNKNLA